MAEVTDRLRSYVGNLFDEPETVIRELEGLRLPIDREPSERVMAGVVLASHGQPRHFEEMLRLAEIDWRDVLVSAGLEGEDWPLVLRRELGPI